MAIFLLTNQDTGLNIMKTNATNQVTTESILLECKGCASIATDWGSDTCRVRNSMELYLPKRWCPCQRCIVKTMCTDICYVYAEYVRYLKIHTKKIQKGSKIQWGK